MRTQLQPVRLNTHALLGSVQKPSHVGASACPQGVVRHSHEPLDAAEHTPPAPHCPWHRPSVKRQGWGDNVVVVLVGLLIGFRSGAGVLAWLAVAGILILFTLALTWIAVIPGLSATSADGASAFAYPLLFLPFISSAFVPTATMPGPVRAFAEHQPVTSIVNAIRDLFTQQPVGTDIWIALAWCVGILIVAYSFAMVIYRRRIA